MRKVGLFASVSEHWERLSGGGVRMWAFLGADVSHWASGRVRSLRCPVFCTIEVMLVALMAG